MFIVKTAADEIANSFDEQLTKLQKDSENVGNVTANITRCLEKAAELLVDAGFTTEAEIIKIVAEDPATKGLTSEKSVQNLKDRGIVLNLPTDKATDLPAEMKGKDSNKDDDGECECEEDECKKDSNEVIDKDIPVEDVVIINKD
jgi:hypothetical protein